MSLAIHRAALHIFDISIIIILLDIDECTSGSPCSSSEVCINLLGTYICLIDASTQIQAGMYACNYINKHAWMHVNSLDVSCKNRIIYWSCPLFCHVPTIL